MGEEIRALAQIKSGQERGQPLEMLLKEARVFGPRQGLDPCSILERPQGGRNLSTMTG